MAKLSIIMPTGRERDTVTLFLKPSKRLVDVSMRGVDGKGSIYLGKDQELIDIIERNKRKSETYDTRNLVDEEKTPTLISIKDMMWKEMKYEPGTLTDIYLRLAKIRLTGKYITFYKCYQPETLTNSKYFT